MHEYLHPNLTDIETIKLVKDKINTKTPFALTRFGDGEIYIINRNANEHFLKKNLKEWGYIYPNQIDKFYDDANTIINQALLKSDIIGLMNKSCNIVSIRYSPHTWSIKKSIIEAIGGNCDKLQICNHMISRTYDFGSIHGFKDIIQGQDFHIISTNTDIIKLKNLEQFFGVNIGYTYHSPDVNFTNRDTFITNFNNIKEKIVIMGIGLQKDYGVILRDNFDKIALDMGATMDAWAGIISRPWFNQGNLQDHLVIK
jgi:hypothetical protein